MLCKIDKGTEGLQGPPLNDGHRVCISGPTALHCWSHWRLWKINKTSSTLYWSHLKVGTHDPYTDDGRTYYYAHFATVYRMGQKEGHKFLSVSLPDTDGFSKIFTVAFYGKFLIKWLINTPPHLNCVVTLLPCEMWISKITVITINTYAKTYLIKQLFTNFLI